MKTIVENEFQDGSRGRSPHQWKFILTAVAILFFIVAKSRAQQNLAGPTGGFNSVEYYPAPAQMQVKSRLAGADAQPIEGGLLDIKKLRLEMFATNGELQAIVTAPECIYDMPNQAANSSGKLFLQNGDEKIHVEGEGFLWRQNDSSLTISNNVKTFIVSMALATVAATNTVAQTNLNAATNSTLISSHAADFDLNSRTAIYRGDVRVTDPQMNLTCAYLIADLPQSGHINHIVAETNVVIDLLQNGQTTHATGEKAVYDYTVKNGVTNETVTLTGNPEVKSPQMHMLADEITWDRIHNIFHASNQHGTIQNLNNTEKTNSPAEMNQLSGTKTNLSGTIENIDKVLPQTQNAP